MGDRDVHSQVSNLNSLWKILFGFLSFLAIYQDLIKVRYMRPLETLHNNLCFKNLNNFLTRMVDSSSCSSSLSKQNSCSSYRGLLKINENFESLDLRDSENEYSRKSLVD